MYHDVQSFIITSDISDHFMCVCIVRDDLASNKRCNISLRKITDDTLRNMNASLRNRNWEDLNNMNLNDSSENLIQEIKTVMDFYAPQRTVTINNKKQTLNQPWYTQGLRKSSRKCFTLFRKVAKKPRDSTEFQNYKIYKRLYSKLCRNAKFAYYRSLIQEHKNNTKKIWQILNKVTGKKARSNEMPVEIIANGHKETNPKIISNAFAEHYSQVGEKLAKSLHDKGNVADPMTYLNNRVQRCCFLYPTTAKEIEKLILNLKVKDSSGYDGISTRILKRIYPGISKALEIIFNKSLREGEFPKNMKLAIIAPIYKGKSKVEISNYRPVSLLPTISKILEKIVNQRVTEFFIKYKILYEGQYGFRKGRSTTDAILDLTGNILENLNKKWYTLGLFLDVSKAFDSLNHKVILAKLEHYGIRGIPLKWFESYLSDRQIKVKYHKETSNPYKMTFGTPQGSVLGPLLFIMLANDLAKSLKLCNIVTFADDTTLFASGPNLKFLYKKVSIDLQNLETWFRSNSLTLNIDKTKYILFRPRRKEVNYNGILKINDMTIERVKYIKFLGVIIDENLQWDFQAKHVVTKMMAGNYSINMIKNMMPTDAKLLVYFANVQSHMTYALSAWGPALRTKDLKKIKVQQNRALRAIFNVNKSKRLSPLYKTGKIMKFEDLINRDLLKITHRYIYDLLPIRVINLFSLSNHSYHTRTRHLLKTMQHTTEQYNKSFLGKAPQLWLNLNPALKGHINIKSFCNAFTKRIIDSY